MDGKTGWKNNFTSSTFFMNIGQQLPLTAFVSIVSLIISRFLRGCNYEPKFKHILLVIVEAKPSHPEHSVKLRILIFLCCFLNGSTSTTTTTSTTTGCTSQASIITAADQQAMIDKTNALRSALATGLMKDKNNVTMDKADNMLKVQWDQSLADDSQKWADCCYYGHSLFADRNAGENIFAQGGGPMDVTSNFIAADNAWWAELAQNWAYRANNIFLGAAEPSQPVGHYTQLAWADTFQVGCGYAQCQDTIFAGFNAVYIVCRYRAPGNYVNSPVYNPSLTGCINGMPCTAASQTSVCDAQGLCDI